MLPTNNPYETPSALVRRAMQEYEGPLVGYTINLVGDIESARDIVQETFIKLYEQEPGRITATGLKAWLYTVCRNRALDSLRRRKRQVSIDDETLPEFVSPDSSPDEQLSQAEEAANVLRFVRRLPANQQEVVKLKFISDLSYKEISAITGLSSSNVGFLIHTALQRLRQMMSPEPLTSSTAEYLTAAHS
jgi:RNA polymerase sigma factor (sigma-70 family)